MDFNFYKKLLSFRSHSRSETQIQFRDWLNAYIRSKYGKKVIISTDKYGNLYVEKGNTNGTTVNCVVAHLDINQRVQTDNFAILKMGEWIVGINKNTGKQIGLGHDDKTGVYFALKALDTFDNIKAFFPLDEEVGCVGTNNSDPTFFDNVGFLVQLDRRGNSDISRSTNGNTVVTKETEEEFSGLLETFGYKFCSCVATDIGVLVGVLDIQGVNISCGYYNEHSNEEVLNTNEYDVAEAFALSVLFKTDGTKYSIFQPPRPVYTPSKGYQSYKDDKKTDFHKGTGTFVDSSKINYGQAYDAYDYYGNLVDEEFDAYENQKQYEAYKLKKEKGKIIPINSTVELSEEMQVKEFKTQWIGMTDLESLALYSPTVINNGFISVINYLVKETTIPDEELIGALEALWKDIGEIEEYQVGRTKLVAARTYLMGALRELRTFI